MWGHGRLVNGSVGCGLIVRFSNFSSIICSSLSVLTSPLVFSWNSRGVVFVGALFIACFMRSGTVCGVTPSKSVNAGSNRTVVGCSYVGKSSDGRGMFEADSMSRYKSFSINIVSLACQAP